MAGGVLQIATRLEFATLEELEAGFADRVGDGALFLSRGVLGALPEELYVGAPVHVVLSTASGEPALDVDGVVAWAYPPQPRTPPGREPGAGILIERHVDDQSRLRAERMRQRPGGGGRVRAPGSRLPALKLAPPTAAPGALAARSLPPGAASLPPGPSVIGPAPGTPPLPSSLLGPPSSPGDTPGPPRTPVPLAPHIDEATGELVVPHPAVPQPRLMAVGMLVDQSFDPTPTPGPMPLPRETADTLPPERMDTQSDDGLPDDDIEDRLTPIFGHPLLQRAPPPAVAPFAGLLGLEPPAGVVPDTPALADAPPPTPTVVGVPRAISLEEMPDAPHLDGPTAERPVVPPSSGPSSVLRADGPFEQRQTDVDLLASIDDDDVYPADKDNPALHESTISSWSDVDDLPSADGDAELVEDGPPVSAEEAGDFRLNETTAIMAALPVAGDADHTTAEASAEAIGSSESPLLPIRPLPALDGFPPAPPQAPGVIGTTFLFSMKRGADPVHAVEAFSWPKSGTKRWNALDVAREEGGEGALDLAVASSPWLARDPSAGKSSFEVQHTDPGVRMADVVDKAVAQAAEEIDDSVFSDTPASVRPAMKATSLDDIDEPTGEATVDEVGEAEPSAAPAAETTIDPEAETDRELKRPDPSRLGVLQKFLGRR